MKLLLLILFGFVIGSIPFGVIFAKVCGVNLKKVGSGNIGATNVLRAMGKVPAVLTLLGDIMKGTLAVMAGRYFLDDVTMEGIVGLSSILGHNFSVFLCFRGGKGVATSIGVLLFYSPKVAIVTIVIWLAVVVFTKYSSLGAIVSFGLLPLSIYLLDYTGGKLFISALIAVLLISRHAGNIKRLINGTESRIGERA